VFFFLYRSGTCLIGEERARSMKIWDYLLFGNFELLQFQRVLLSQFFTVSLNVLETRCFSFSAVFSLCRCFLRQRIERPWLCLINSFPFWGITNAVSKQGRYKKQCHIHSTAISNTHYRKLHGKRGWRRSRPAFHFYIQRQCRGKEAERSLALLSYVQRQYYAHQIAVFREWDTSMLTLEVRGPRFCWSIATLADSQKGHDNLHWQRPNPSNSLIFNGYHCMCNWPAICLPSNHSASFL